VLGPEAGNTILLNMGNYLPPPLRNIAEDNRCENHKCQSSCFLFLQQWWRNLARRWWL